MAVINNVVASWSMIQLKMTNSSANTLGVTDPGGETGLLIDATSIKWNTSRKVEDIYGLGGQSRGRGFGNVTYTASITLPYNTIETLISHSSTGTLMGLGEFNLVISWTTDLAQSVNYNDVTLAGCFFSEMGLEANQDDTSITHEYDLHPFRIYNKKNQTAGASWSMEMYSK